MIAFFALLLDALLGEPKFLWSRVPHPAVLCGRLIAWGDARFNHETDPEATRRVNGFLCTTALVFLAVVVGYGLGALPFGGVISVFVAAVLLAQRSLVDHVRAVGDALRLSPRDGQIMVARIVGRDTKDMSAPAVSRAAIESAAENFSDGLVAPLFWLLIGGLPGLLTYKAVNTADSMIGYRTPRHAAFGMAAARLDDVLNWVPARLTAGLFLLVGYLWGGAEVRLAEPAEELAESALENAGFSGASGIARDASQHRSPNAGWPEAALARVLGVALAGPRSYAGALRDFPWVNAPGNRSPSAADIDAATVVLWRAWWFCLVLALITGLF